MIFIFSRVMMHLPVGQISLQHVTFDENNSRWVEKDLEKQCCQLKLIHSLCAKWYLISIFMKPFH